MALEGAVAILPKKAAEASIVHLRIHGAGSDNFFKVRNIYPVADFLAPEGQHFSYVLVPLPLKVIPAKEIEARVVFPEGQVAEMLRVRTRFLPETLYVFHLPERNAKIVDTAFVDQKAVQLVDGYEFPWPPVVKKPGKIGAFTQELFNYTNQIATSNPTFLEEVFKGIQKKSAQTQAIAKLLCALGERAMSRGIPLIKVLGKIPASHLGIILFVLSVLLQLAQKETREALKEKIHEKDKIGLLGILACLVAGIPVRPK